MSTATANRLRGKSVLIVEDEPLIALGLHAALRAEGSHIIAAVHVPEALRLIERNEISAAVLDLSLEGQDCAPICEALARKRVPFLFYTGYPDAPILSDWPTLPVFPRNVARKIAAVRLHGQGECSPVGGNEDMNICRFSHRTGLRGGDEDYARGGAWPSPKFASIPS